MSTAQQSDLAAQHSRFIDGLKILRVIGGVSGVLIMILGFYQLQHFSLSPKSFINGLYQILFGLLIIICELRLQAILKFARFLTHFLGLGLFYFFVGGLALGGEWYQIAVGIALMVVGVIYVMLGLCCRTMSHSTFEFIQQRSSSSSKKQKSTTEKSSEAVVEEGESQQRPQAIKDLQREAAYRAVDYAVDNPDTVRGFVGAYPK